MGRGYCAWDAAPGAGGRNGCRTDRLKSAEGSIEYSAPQIADRAEPFRSRIRTLLDTRAAELEALAVEMRAGGLSTRDIEALLSDESGQSLPSRTAASEITEFGSDRAERTAPAVRSNITAPRPHLSSQDRT